MERLTARQQEVLGIIRNFIVENGYPPTVRELGDILGMGPRAVHDHLKALERKGHIEREEGLPRAISFPGEQGYGTSNADIPHEMVKLPILGRIAAGSPILAGTEVPQTAETMVVDRSLTSSGKDFLLRIAGDSMINAHIMDGDLVIVRPQQTADPGAIVAVLIGEEATVKRFMMDGNRPFLQAENTDYPDIELNEVDSPIIVGLVVGVIRRFKQ